MELLDDNLYRHFTSGRISAEECIDKSKIPGQMVERMRRAGLNIEVEDDALSAEADDAAAGTPAPTASVIGKPQPGQAAAAAADPDRQAQIAANRARMAAMQAKR